MLKWLKFILSADKKNSNVRSVNDILTQAKKSSDYQQYSPIDRLPYFQLHYFKTLVDSDHIKRYVLPGIQRNIEGIKDLESLMALLPVDEAQILTNPSDVEQSIHTGCLIIRLHPESQRVLAVNFNNSKLGHRPNNDTENEFSVMGPKAGFVENIEVNMHLLRQTMAVSNLVFEEMTVGSLSKTKIVIAYLDGITNPRYIQTMRQRLEDVDYEIVYDTSMLDQLISDNSNTTFPLFLTTERIDRVMYTLSSGQVAVFSDGSPYVITGPSVILDFFISPEDYYLPWILGSFFRVIRITGVIFSIFATPLYVAVMTYHFEVIPVDLLEPLIKSRVHVPFSPFLEALFLELTIELLREAGARLPAKIGQTLGIVGGIVIGQATVQAALASSILLIIVALSALASFTTPIVKMANTIRLLRYPFILLAAVWGGFGIAAGILVLLGHLLRLKSLGNPYLVPLYPFRTGNYADSFIRTSFQNMINRSKYLKPLILKRFSPAVQKEDLDDE